MCARALGGQGEGCGGRRRRRESRRQEEGRRERGKEDKGGERESRERKRPGEIKLQARNNKRARGKESGARERERERETGPRGRRDKREAEGREVSLCARVSVRVSVQGRARAGGGRAPGLPSSPARSSRSLANSGPQPRAGARRKDSMLSLLVWILTLSDTFSQGKLPHPPAPPAPALAPPHAYPGGRSVRPDPGNAEGLGSPRPVRGGRDATRWGLGPRAE